MDDPDDQVTSLVPVNPQNALTRPDFREIVEEAKRIYNREGAENTERTYTSAWKAFETWCDSHSLQSMPASPSTVVVYLTALTQTAKVSTAQVHLSAINAIHIRREQPPPGDDAHVRRFMRNLRKEKGTRAEPKQHINPEQMAAMLIALDLGTLTGLRNRAVLLLVYALGGRRQECSDLDVSDVHFDPRGLVVVIQRSKTDQEGAGETLGIPHAQDSRVCPVEAVRAWKAAAGITEGPLFRTIDRHGNMGPRRLPPRSVADIVKTGIEVIGLDPANYAAHSLRSGLATSAAEEGVQSRDIQRRLRHTTSTMTDRYIHAGTLFVNNPATPVLDRLVRALHKMENDT